MKEQAAAVSRRTGTARRRLPLVRSRAGRRVEHRRLRTIVVAVRDHHRGRRSAHRDPVVPGLFIRDRGQRLGLFAVEEVLLRREQPYQRVMRGSDHGRVGGRALKRTDDAEVRLVAVRDCVDRLEYRELHRRHRTCRGKWRGGTYCLDSNHVPLQNRRVGPIVHRRRSRYGAQRFARGSSEERHEQRCARTLPKLDAKRTHDLVQLIVHEAKPDYNQ